MASPAPLLLGLAILAAAVGGGKKSGGGNGGTATGDAKPSGGKLPWGVEDERTRTYQNAINARLAPAGYMTIEPDGKLGKVTCAAGRFVAQNLAVPALAPSAVNADCRAFGEIPRKATGDVLDPKSPLGAAERFTFALGSGDVEVMRRVARELRADGASDFAASLDAIADDLERQNRAAAQGAAAAGAAGAV